MGLAVAQVDRDGRPQLSATIPGTDDARPRRAQAAAASSPIGLQITRGLLGAKLAGQAAVTRDLLDDDRIAEQLDDLGNPVRDGRHSDYLPRPWVSGSADRNGHGEAMPAVSVEA